VSDYVGKVVIVSWMLTIACCLAVGLGCFFLGICYSAVSERNPIIAADR